MKNWEKCEKIVSEMSGGKLTPGSGNKKIKGDVILRGSGWTIEVKSTEKDWMNIQAKWFEKLEKLSNQFDLALVVFFDLRGYVYYMEGQDNANQWSTMKVVEESLPEKIVSNSGKVWVLDSLSSLREL